MVASRLFKSVGVTGGVIVGDSPGAVFGHAWNWVTLPSQGAATYWVSPQTDPLVTTEPVFFNRQASLTPCEQKGTAYCAVSADACTTFYDFPTDASCAGSTSGSQCCLVAAVPAVP